MNLEFVLECVSSCYLAWRFVLSAEDHIVEFSVIIVGCTKLAIACCNMSGM
jgi:hypothetical protein